METTSIHAQPRDGVGKGPARSLRRNGLIPAVVYGHGLDPQPLAVPTHDLEKVLQSISWENTLVNLHVGANAPAAVLIRDVQFHPFKPEILHVDFMQIRAGEKIEVEVPVELIGTPPGVKAGGVLEQQLHSVSVWCDPSRIPEKVDVDVSTLEIGDSLHVSDLRIPEVEILTEATTTLAVVVPPAVLKVEEAEAAEVAEEEAEPEVVGRGRRAEEGEAEEEEGAGEGEERGERGKREERGKRRE